MLGPVTDQRGPDSGQADATPAASELMIRITSSRTATWALLVELSDRPDAELVRRLCEEPLLDTLRDSVRWLQEEWQPRELLVLEVLPRQAGRRGSEATLEMMLDAHVAAGSLVRRLHAGCAQVHALCLQEAAAWLAGEQSRAKTHRVEQMSLLTPDSQVRQDAREMQQLGLPVYSHVAGLVTAYLKLETGR